MTEQQRDYLFHTNAVIASKTSQQAHARLVTILDLCHTCINTASARYPRNLSVTLQQARLCRYFTRDLCHTSVNTTDSRDYSLSSPGKKSKHYTDSFIYFDSQHKVLELSGSTKLGIPTGRVPTSKNWHTVRREKVKK